MSVQRERGALELEFARSAAYREARNGGVDAVDSLLRSPLIDAQLKLNVIRALNAAFAFGVDKGIGFAKGEESPEVGTLIRRDQAGALNVVYGSAPAQQQIDEIVHTIPGDRRLSVVFDFPIDLKQETK